jgi:hypothetical protein
MPLLLILGGHVFAQIITQISQMFLILFYEQVFVKNADKELKHVILGKQLYAQIQITHLLELIATPRML